MGTRSDTLLLSRRCSSSRASGVVGKLTSHRVAHSRGVPFATTTVTFRKWYRHVNDTNDSPTPKTLQIDCHFFRKRADRPFIFNFRPKARPRRQLSHDDYGGPTTHWLKLRS